MAHAPLITRAELPVFGCPADFLAQFEVRRIRARISEGGALGVMSVEWQLVGEEDYGDLAVSSSAAPWSWSPTPGATLTFAAGTYAVGAEYTVDEAGAVTRTPSSAANLVTAVRVDLVANAIAAATAEAVTRMQPGKQLAIISWGADVKRHAAALVRYFLKDAAREAREYFDDVGARKLSPWEMVDSSPSGKGSNLFQSIASDDPTWY